MKCPTCPGEVEARQRICDACGARNFKRWQERNAPEGIRDPFNYWCVSLMREHNAAKTRAQQPADVVLHEHEAGAQLKRRHLGRTKTVRAQQ